MKKIVLVSFMLLFALCGNAQNATQAKAVLDKAASIVGHQGGASADFKIASAKYGNTTGTIYIKGNKFHARTPQAVVWYNGKTQWTYMKNTNEVNVSTPSEAQKMSMNPYTFITMYKNGYNLGVKTLGSRYQVHLTAQNQKRSVQEMYIMVNAKSYVPTEVKMRQGKTWTTIAISNFKAKNQSDGLFVFRSKDYPSAEVVDLR